MSKKIYVENDYDGLYGRFWESLGELSRDREEFLNHPKQFDLVCFTGGEDVSPELYGHKNLGSHCSSARDKREVTVFEMASKHEIPMTGICRGSQFLNVMCGGTMVQHLRQDHGGYRHGMLAADNRVMEVTSSHHQMSVLAKGGTLLGRAEQLLPLKALVYDGDLEKALAESGNLWDGRAMVTEAFAYPKQRIFAVQHHPEWQDIDEEAAQWTLDMIARICWEQETRQRTLDEIMDVFGCVPLYSRRE
ncbi:MAG: hypothetical protein GF334_06790 [Candidatus Altiarchaeales archaeon]|nr:hypothetical protein [Candidatus Altiarchaeales archaeon]